MQKNSSNKGKVASIEAEARIQDAIKRGNNDLNLQGLGLKELPKSVGKLTQLKVLRISRNQLTKLPNFLGRMINLEELYLGDNCLTKIPNFFCNFSKLRVLVVWGNKINEIPSFFGDYTSLHALHLSDNKLKALPNSFKKLMGLSELYLHGNSALGLPPEVLGPTAEDVVLKEERRAVAGNILDYYFRVSIAKRPLNEAKLILVGRGGVGKTSLAKRLLFNQFNKKEAKTEGICISEWKLRLQNKEMVRLNLWDFGGQEIMHATHQFFLTHRSLYLLVLEGRQGAEDSDAEYWLKLIESFGTESSGEISPLLVVLNKVKVHPFDLNRRALQQKYPFIRGFITTDCDDRTGIKDLRVAIQRETDRLNHLRDAFPASWFAIKNRLSGMKENFITFDKNRNLCSELGEKDTVGQDQLAYYLHSLGIALNYKDDPRLRDMHVLNPHWVTNSIYKILNAPQLAESKGELHLEDVADILDARKYPRQMHRFIFDLMKKFELCFTFPDDDVHYLIPELLDKQEPAETAVFQLTESLNFEYRYQVLPEGLLPRFIVRTHALSSGMPRWRTGVVLTFEDNRALVKADVQDKRVFISVSGSSAGRRRLLAIIRSDFEQIHSDISKLKPEALVPVPGRPKTAVRYSKLIALEKKGKETFDEEVDDEIIELDVQKMLNGVDLAGERQRENIAERPLKLFYSYSHKDEQLRDELETHLKLLQRTGLISEWHDRKIEAGDDWKTRIDENLEHADVILLLVSADFIASDYCYEKEMKYALERHEARKARVVPVIIRDVNWKRAPFSKLKALPKDGKAVDIWDNKDSAWRNVSEGIEVIVNESRNRVMIANRPLVKLRNRINPEILEDSNLADTEPITPENDVVEL